jgi:hypothetical protein
VRSTATTFYTDGSRVETDEGADGSVDVAVDHFVDPVTGAPVTTHTDRWGSLSDDTWTYDPVTGWLTDRRSVDATTDARWAWGHDTVGRVLTEDYEAVPSQGPVRQEHTTYTWTCPAP